MIRNAVLHLESEQPLMADLFRLPQAGDQGLLLTNLRMMNGSRPVFIDDIRSTFYFPWARIRFVEVPAAALAAAGAEVPAGTTSIVPAGPVTEANDGTGRPGPAGSAALPATGEPGAQAATPEPAKEPAAPAASSGAAEVAGSEGDGDLELDEDLLRRVRDI